MYYTYVLSCSDSSGQREHYVGSTEDLRKRLKQHRANEVQSTKGSDKIELVYYEACRSKTDARRRELQLKTGFGRGYLKRRLEHDIAGFV